MGNKGDSLEAFLIGTLSESLGVVAVSDLVRLTGGANRETWSFDAVDAEGNAAGLIVQVDREGLDRLIGTCAKEAQIVTKAAEWKVPVATVVASSDIPNALGRSFTITRRIDGETIARKILRDKQWETARSKLVTDCATALAAIHSIPLEQLDGIELVKDTDSLTSLVEIYDALSDHHPTFDLAIRWLEENRPEPLGPCLVHGDFRLGNLLIGIDGLRAVLDWEIAHIGDPAADLGWMCVRAWRFGGKEKVAGIGGYTNFLNDYETQSGTRVPLETLQWWEIFGTLRWGIICLQMGGDFRAGRTSSIEIATIGRRVAENEYDLLSSLKEQLYEFE